MGKIGAGNFGMQVFTSNAINQLTNQSISTMQSIYTVFQIKTSKIFLS